MSATKAVQRHRTIPMTKRDSLSTSGSRLSLISNNSNASNQKHLEEHDSKNTHLSMTAGQKRTTEIKRTDSYRRATARQSVYDNEDVFAPSEEVEKINSSVNGEGRRKYNTLPIRREDNNNVIDASNNCNHKSKKEKVRLFNLQTSNSVRSGTYPSPDTDDDQRSVQPERKKKSGFKRFKERLVLTFRKNDTERKWRSEKQKQSKDHSSSKHSKSGRRKSHKSDKHETEKLQHDRTERDVNSNRSCEDGFKGQNGSACEGQSNTKVISQTSPGKIRRELNIFKSFRDSFRRKSSAENLKQGSKDSSKRNSSEDQTGNSSVQKSTNHPSYGREKQGTQSKDEHRRREYSEPHHGTDKYMLKGDRNSSDIQVVRPKHNNKEHGGERNTQFTGETKHTKNSRESLVDELDDTFEEGENLTTDIFGAIIDPDYERQHALWRQGQTQAQSKGPDRSKLRLEGLRSCRPRSFEKTPSDVARSSFHRQSNDRTTVVNVHRDGRHFDLSPEVELDGPDFADGAFESPEDEQSELSDAFFDADDQTRKAHKVAQCLKTIADKVVEEKQRSVAEDEIVIALREIGDSIDTRFQGKGIPGVPRELLPLMKHIIAAKTYASFSDVIQREISKTIGWEQVAWYTFLTKSALHITGVGKQVGRRIRSRSMRYFSSKIRPWVESRPNGWESIHEETDIESELD